MENHGGMITTGETSDLSTKALRQSYQRNLVAKLDELAKEMMSFASSNISLILLGFLNILKIVHEADCFTSPSKEEVLRIFIAVGRV
jgi:hypothetical protein